MYQKVNLLKMYLLNVIDIYGRRAYQRLKRFESYQSRKRFILIILGLCTVFFYTGPAFLRWLWRKTPLLIDTNVQCLEEHIDALIGNENPFDNSVRKNYNFGLTTSRQFIPYVGNGLMGLVIEDGNNKPLYIYGKRSLDIALPFSPIVTLLFNGRSQSSSIIRFTNGLVNRITCYKYLSKSISVLETFYAHRTYSSLLVQDIKIINPSDVPLSVNLHREQWHGKEVKKETLVLEKGSKSKGIEEYELIETKVDSRQTLKSNGLIVIMRKIPELLTVQPRSEGTFTLKTFLNYSQPTFDSQLSGKIPELKKSLKEVARSVVKIDSSFLMKHHTSSWNKIWSSRFGMSFSKAEGALNGDTINATLYYILSQRLVLGDKLKISQSRLLRPDNCYDGHSTLQAPALWSHLDSISDINRIVSLWLLTLEKQGCHNLIESGVEGTLQAAILSMASIQFTKDHLELNSDPKHLHREYFICRIRYDNSTLVNITVNLGLDNKAVIFANIDRNLMKKDFYACDGGCLDTPVMLSSVPMQFPVKLTNPRTAILYITSDHQHINDLKHTLHVSDVAVAPPHEHHIIALHRHGHQLGGLPALFWVSIIFLIVVFHLFLAKLIYNEYCGGGGTVSSNYERVKYAV